MSKQGQTLRVNFPIKLFLMFVDKLFAEKEITELTHKITKGLIEEKGTYEEVGKRYGINSRQQVEEIFKKTLSHVDAVFMSVFELRERNKQLLAEVDFFNNQIQKFSDDLIPIGVKIASIREEAKKLSLGTLQEEEDESTLNLPILFILHREEVTKLLAVKGIKTIQNLLRCTPRIVLRACGGKKDLLEEIRQSLAIRGRYLSGDEKYYKDFLEKQVSNPSIKLSEA